MWDTAGEARTNSLVMFFYGPLHIDEFISYILLWTPSHGYASVDWPVRTYLQDGTIKLLP